MERKLWTEPYDARLVAEGLMLRRDEIVGIRNGRGALVFVESGTAWITQEHDRRDLLVPAGGTFRLDRDGVALVGAHRSATISISAPLGGAEPEVYRSGAAAAPRGRRGHPLARRMWAVVLRLYRRHARPRPWEIRQPLPEAVGATRLWVLDPIGPGPRAQRDPAAGLRAAIALDMSRAA
jgi:hypothetical protein